MLHPISEQEFNTLARQGYNRIPLVCETFADLDTPLSLYLKLANQPYSYLLESVQGGERFGRYSFIGLPADIRISVRGRQITLTHLRQDGVESTDTVGGAKRQFPQTAGFASNVSLPHHSTETTHDVENPLDYIRDFQTRFKVALPDNLPRFCGGLAGYFGYETIRYIEPRLSKVHKPDAIGTPDILLMLTEQLAVVDNLTGKLTFIVYANPEQADAYSLAKQRLHELTARLRSPVDIPRAPPTHGGEARSEFGETAFKEAVVKAKQYIVDGDIMQVVLSQRMSQPFPASALSLYRALRSVNPSPYMFYYDMGDHHVVGASPEILVRLESDTVTVRPIAGTRPRGKTQEQDAELARDLLADPKELAEHLMLIDLGRNDIGRVAQNGTVKLTEKMIIERYSHVMHIVSNVEARLKPGFDAMDVLKATFPAGTVSGAAKVRAMEIIDELEPSKRGIYAGAVGYLGFNGDMDLAIALRTAVVKDNMLYAQVGAGIVADSVPDSEWIETLNKARAVLRAGEMVLAGLDNDA
jgi:anthranilate synthase component I